MTNVDTLRKKIESKIPHKKERGNKLICDRCREEVREISVYGNQWLCLKCEKELNNV